MPEYKGVIFSLGVTGETELDNLRNRKGRLANYFDTVMEDEPIDGYISHKPDRLHPGRTFHMNPILARSGETCLLFVPTTSQAIKRGGGSVVDRIDYFKEGENIVGVGMCCLHSQDYQHGDIVIPDQVDNSPSLRNIWGEGYESGFPDVKLRDALHQRCLDNGLTVVRLPLTLSVLNWEESENWDRIPGINSSQYGAREMEMAAVLAYGRKLGKPSVGALVISDRSGEQVDIEYFRHLPERAPKVEEAGGKLFEAVVNLFIH